jgi:hypothetical protein
VKGPCSHLLLLPEFWVGVEGVFFARGRRAGSCCARGGIEDADVMRLTLPAAPTASRRTTLTPCP